MWLQLQYMWLQLLTEKEFWHLAATFTVIWILLFGGTCASHSWPMTFIFPLKMKQRGDHCMIFSHFLARWNHAILLVFYLYKPSSPLTWIMQPNKIDVFVYTGIFLLCSCIMSANLIFSLIPAFFPPARTGPPVANSHIFLFLFFSFSRGPLLDWVGQIMLYSHWSTQTWCSKLARVPATDEAVLYTFMTVELAMGFWT